MKSGRDYFKFRRYLNSLRVDDPELFTEYENMIHMRPPKKKRLSAKRRKAAEKAQRISNQTKHTAGDSSDPEPTQQPVGPSHVVDADQDEVARGGEEEIKCQIECGFRTRRLHSSNRY